ncbi:uncharacterized protein N7511_001894 [Penicillium nucicola]|uniref:uncharacterized protein n=1 Tax=Penicillium nucicola TaxID=1850975 RepID=UPI0025451573|nr:uncharacterized protein N7511_001894 [Penicillium nucicola]KAJ5769843.1 hypothetical protein N7511_001894 [Penicillium nucicola]
MRHIAPRVAWAAICLAALATAIPHGDDESTDMGMDMGASTAVPQSSPTAHVTSSGPMSYFAYGKHSSSIIAHIALMVVAWCFVLPVAVMLSIARSRIALPSQLLFLVFNAFGLLFGIIYNDQTPDLYENNAHHKIGWVITSVITVQVILALIFTCAGRGQSTVAKYEHANFLPVSTDEHEHEHEHVYPNGAVHEYRWSRDSGQGTDSNSPSIRGPGSPSCEWSGYDDGFEKPEELPPKPSKSGHWFQKTNVGRFLTEHVPDMMSSRALRGLNVVYNIIDRIILPFGFATLATGAIAYSGIMRGHEIFNGLAHWIKGGIFFWYGLLTLGRYVGCWADLGWAWNEKPSASVIGAWKARIPTGEATESFVIFLYGVTNVFLEHMSNAGGEWSPTDLEHVSISVLFFGGGLLGMLFESNTIRDWLNATILQIPRGSSDEAWQAPKTQRVSLNPMPALVIMLLGMMMGSHHQTSMTSTMVHKQWGNLLVGFAIARGMTYVLMFLKPPTSYLPARPPTEIIASFCLISGGLIFMMSTRNVIEAMEYYSIDAMFTFTVGLGFSAFIMAYGVLCIALKAWAMTRTQRSQPTFRFP